MLSAIIIMLVVAASFGVGFVCGRGLRREETTEAEDERAMREE